MLPQRCRILLRHEVQKHFESGRQVIEVVAKVLQTHMKSFKTQAKEKAEADGNLRQLGGEHDDIKEVLLTLASLHKDTSALLKDLSKRMDSPVAMLNRWLSDPSIKKVESFITENIDDLTDQHIHIFAKIAKLHKVYSKKKRMMARVQQQIDSYPFSGTDMSLSDLKIKVEHFRLEALAAEQRYRNALDNEVRNRLEFIKKVEELKDLFIKHEEKRLLTLVDCIGKYSSILTAYYSDPQDKMRAILTDLTELSLVYSPDEQIEKFLAHGYRELSFPAPQIKEEFLSVKNTEQDDQKLNLDTMVPPSVTPTEQLTRTSDTSGNANRRVDEKNGDRGKDIYSQYMDTKVPCLPNETRTGRPSELTAHPNTPRDVVRGQLTPSNAQALPLIPKPNMHEDTPVKTSPRPLKKMEGLPQIACPEIAIQRIMSKREQKPVQFMQGDSSQEVNQLPKLPRSMIGTPELTNSQYKETMEQSPIKPKHVDSNTLVKSVVEKNEMSAQRNQPQNGSSPHLIMRTKSRMDGNLLPKMPTSGNSMMSSFMTKSDQENVNQGKQAPWIKSKTTSLPQLSTPTASKDSTERSHLPDIMVDSVATKLPVVLKPGIITANTPVSYANPDSQIAKPSMPSRKGGFSILPSKPKVLIDSGYVQSFMVRPTTENTASDTLRSRHRVGVVKQSGHLSSGIAAGFRGSSSNKDFKSKQGLGIGPQGSPVGMVNNTLGSHKVVNNLQEPQGMVSTLHRPNRLGYNLHDQQGMAMTPQEQRGKADGAPYMTQGSDINSGLHSQRARAGTTANTWMRKDLLSDQGSLFCREGDRKSAEQVNFNNADRLLSKYDIRNLGIGDNREEEEEDVCKRADRLLAMHDIRNICSEESLLEQEM
ncbi:uncharacterized protein LOC117336904 [Pecten maximus]|uniref:uncharacterized protein LOC117336904 n=1 Tax=Pecten maximus TaxID=6579 RepID=UPI001458EE69|nr:uncharacterized protein LOC117336904 [Pecten maximus]